MAGGFAVLGCESDGPLFVGDEETRVIEGRLTIDEVRDTSFFALVREGTLNIQTTTILGIDPGTGEPIEEPSLGVAVGAPLPENNEECQLTFTQELGEGDSYSVYFRDGLYCVSVFRVPGTDETTVFDYVLTLTGAFS